MKDTPETPVETDTRRILATTVATAGVITDANNDDAATTALLAGDSSDVDKITIGGVDQEGKCDGLNGDCDVSTTSSEGSGSGSGDGESSPTPAATSTSSSAFMTYGFGFFALLIAAINAL